MPSGRPDQDQNLPPPSAVREWVVALPSPGDSPPALPAPISTLIGRNAEIARLTAVLDDPEIRLVTLTGPGGIGKTRLALAVASAMQEHLAGGAVFIDLSTVTRASDVIPVIAQALRLRERNGKDQERQVIEYLRSKNLLLVLDNLEQILDAAPRIGRIAREASGTTFLLTSRAPLRIGGEREVPVPPLALAVGDASPDELLASAAGRLFVERAHAHGSSLIVDEQTAPLIAEICSRLDGLPLAIELAAARTRLLSPRQLRDRLEQTLPLLVRGDRDASPRHLTMRDAIAWSYDLLTPKEQVLFRQLAIFPGGFTLDAVEWMGRQESASAGATGAGLDHLEALLDQSLVARDIDLEGNPRFRMLETIRAYGQELLSQEEEEAARDYHALYYRALTQQLYAMVVTESERAALERLAAEEANLRSALTWLADQGLAADFGAMVAALSGYWLAFSRLTEATTWIGRAMARLEEIPGKDRARLLVASAILSWFRGDTAPDESTEAISLSRSVGNTFDLAMALTSYGASWNNQGRFAEASELLEEGFVVSGSIVEPRQRAAMTGRSLANLSVTARGQGDYARATSLCEAALDCYHGLGFDLAETRVFMDLAGIAEAQGDIPLTVTHCQTCLRQTGERGDMRVVWIALAGIAGACAIWEQPETAVLLFAASEAVRERVGLARSLQSAKADAGRELAALREVLGEAEFADRWAEGRDLPLAQVLALAESVAPAPAGSGKSSPRQRMFLTRREQDVLRLLAEGQSDRDIAAALYIGPRTVSWHVRSILSKLDVTSRSKAAIKAHTEGLI